MESSLQKGENICDAAKRNALLRPSVYISRQLTLLSRAFETVKSVKTCVLMLLR